MKVAVVVTIELTALRHRRNLKTTLLQKNKINMFLTQSHKQIMQIKKILNEDEDRFDHLLSLLGKWMDSHAFLPKNYDKRMLPTQLRYSKYNLDKTKQRLQLYFIYKRRYPEVFRFYEFNEMEKKSLDNYYLFEASKLTPEGYQVLISGYRSSDTTGCDFSAVNKFVAMYGTYKAHRDPIICGIILIIDLRHLSPSIVSGVLNSLFKKMLEMLQKIAPFRIGGIYATYLPGFVVPIANVLKMMLNEKIRNRVTMEAKNDQMKKNIPMYCLPEEFGGTDGTINENAARCMQEIMQAKPWFLEQEQIQMIGDIPKDLYEASAIEENFGTQGSFRKLNID